MAGIRVIAGGAKGQRLFMVPGESTRPIPDRVKEALFNILATDVAGAAFLDLFAGTGSVGIEALSRGAARAVFLDLDRQAVRTIHANLALTGLEDRAEVHRIDAFRYLQAPGPTFDYVFVAPPQYRGLWRQALELLDQDPARLNPDAWVIVQMDPKELEPLSLARLEHFDQRKYGRTLLTFYELSGE